MDRGICLLLASACLFAVAACSDDSANVGGGGADGTSSTASSTAGPGSNASSSPSSSVATSAATTQAASSSSTGMTTGYPPGPYGLDEGDVIDNYLLRVIVDPSASQTFVDVPLADLHNPTGTDVFEAGSPFGAGTPKPVALLLVVCSAWTGPCGFQAEAMPAKYAEYEPLGAELIFLLIDGPVFQTPATEQNVVGWTTAHPAAFPNGLDPQQALVPDGIAAYPTNLVVDLQSMTIVDVTLGVPPEDGETWQALDQLTL